MYCENSSRTHAADHRYLAKTFASICTHCACLVITPAHECRLLSCMVYLSVRRKLRICENCTLAKLCAFIVVHCVRHSAYSSSSLPSSVCVYMYFLVLFVYFPRFVRYFPRFVRYFPHFVRDFPHFVRYFPHFVRDFPHFVRYFCCFVPYFRVLFFIFEVLFLFSLFCSLFFVFFICCFRCFVHCVSSLCFCFHFSAIYYFLKVVISCRLPLFFFFRFCGIAQDLK